MKDLFINLLAHLRSLSLYYQTAHWSVKTSLFYQDHLLFERLYKDIDLDAIAEKAVGLTDCDAVHLPVNLKKVYEKIKALPQKPSDNSDFFKAALQLEQELIALCEAFESADGVSLGLKNLLADLADNSENRTYLIKQRLSK